MPLFETTPIDDALVASLVLDHYQLTLGKILKRSQNHTFEATQTSGARCAVRVTPGSMHLSRIEREIHFLNYLADQAMHHRVCRPLPMQHTLTDSKYILCSNNLIIVVFQWAVGEPIDFLSYSWLVNEELIHQWGYCLGEIHNNSRSYAAQYPSLTNEIQSWSTLHNNLLYDLSIPSIDEATKSDPNIYGILHGDLNISNFFYQSHPSPTLSVFDFDQVHLGWFAWDIAQAVLVVYMLAEAGSVVDESRVPDAVPERFVHWFLTGYNSCSSVPVERDQVERMVLLRKVFYKMFCAKAEEEGGVPHEMQHFIQYVNTWMKKINMS